MSEDVEYTEEGYWSEVEYWLEDLWVNDPVEIDEEPA